MATKAEIAAKIQADITEINTPGGIKKTKVADILRDITDLAMPAITSGNGIPIYEIDGSPVYQKIIRVATGNDIETTDFSLPENNTLIGYNTFGEVLPKLNCGFEISAADDNGSQITQLACGFSWFLGDAGTIPINAEGILDVMLTYDDNTTETLQFIATPNQGIDYQVLAKDVSELQTIALIDLTILPTSTFRLYNQIREKADFNLNQTQQLSIDLNDPGNGAYLYLSNNSYLNIPVRIQELDYEIPTSIVYVGGTNKPHLANILVVLTYYEPS